MSIVSRQAASFPCSIDRGIPLRLCRRWISFTALVVCFLQCSPVLVHRLRGSKTQNKQARRQRGESKSATQGVGGKKKWLYLTPLSVFKIVAFVRSESVIPAIPDGKGDRFLCFTYCCQATYVVACSLERSDVKIRCSFA